MKRRTFLHSVAAVLTVPMIPGLGLRAGAMGAASSGAVPAQARFWAIYLSGLRGECTPQALQGALGVSEGEATRYLGQLVSEGIIRPNPFLQKTASALLKGRQDSVFDRLRQRLDRKAQTNRLSLDELLPDQAETPDHNDAEETGSDTLELVELDELEELTSDEIPALQPENLSPPREQPIG